MEVFLFPISIPTFVVQTKIKMIYLLQLETSTKNCSVAISKNGQTILCKEVADLGYSHAEKLHVFIEEILQEVGITYQDIHAIAVSKGPGSYTGLRIGVSAAKGLAYALDIPLIAIDTLESLARKISITEGVIIPMVDARRMECYTAILDANYKVLQAVSAEIITAESYQEMESPIHLIGDGAPKCQSVLVGDKFLFHEEIQYPSAAEMSSIAYQKFQDKDLEDVAYFEPFYLKDFMVPTSNKA